MHISKITVKNFRLLRDISLSLESDSTLIVGRNNSGKTSLTELMKRFLSDSSIRFYIEDFSSQAIDEFWESLRLYQAGEGIDVVRSKIPSIEVRFYLSYEKGKEIGQLNHFIVDVDEEATETLVVVRYQIKQGSIRLLFEGSDFSAEESDEKKKLFCKNLKDKIPKLYNVELCAHDPNDLENYKNIEMSQLRELICAGFITAQRGLDDITNKERDVLGKILEKLFSSATMATARDEEKEIASQVDAFIKKMQLDIDENLAGKLQRLLPALKLFGYPGLNDQELRAETILNVEALLGNHTKLRYKGKNGIGFPESYNGLGSRNLIFIFFQLYEFFKSYCAMPVAPSFHLIFIEEPEAHLHPQMQEVFIKQLTELSKLLSEELGEGKKWPVQFIVSTHSTHMSNEANLESIRYFLNTNDPHPQTKIKDLRFGFSQEILKQDKDFLHKFLALTSCDLFFCDKAILVEGSSEKILMPVLINKIDASISDEKLKLSSQYVTTFEVGGAYSHNFFNFLDFLELKTLIITDLDTVKKTESDKSGKVVYVAHPFEGSTHTSNASIKKWFKKDKEITEKSKVKKESSEAEEKEELTPNILILKTEKEKIKGKKRICYQVAEDGMKISGRTFEDSFIMANATKYGIAGNEQQVASEAFAEAQNYKKTDFAYNLAIDDGAWIVPKYISEGLRWLSTSDDNEIKEAIPSVATVVEEKNVR